MLFKTSLLCSVLGSTTLLACATEEGFTPITDDREDTTVTLHESQGQCLQADGCDMGVHLSYAGRKMIELDVTLIDPTTEHVLVDAWGVYSYDAESDRSTWSFSYWDGSFGEYTALAKSKAGPLSEVQFSWQSGKSVYKDRYNPSIGQSCNFTYCPEELECMKLHDDFAINHVCVTRCFTDAQCSADCQPPPTGDLAVEGVKGVCSSSAIQG